MAANYSFGPFEVKAAARELLLDGQPVAIGRRAVAVLLALVERPNRLVTKDELLDIAWPGLVVEENNLQVQISSLRKILGDGVIKTVQGRGYLFTAQLDFAEATPRTARHNLPHALTRFIGHDVDLDRYLEIARDSRLVTLTGSGGCGKTRLAVELAARLLPSFEHGVWFIDLAPMADAERLPLIVARTFDLPERPTRAMAKAVCEHIADRQLLVVLDNCEHLLVACAALVASMLRRAPRLHVLATSREPLGIPGEQTLRVRSLSCPPAGNQFADALETYEAVQLFADRARLAQPEFAVDAVTGPSIAEICRHLDGIPLAIELAAAQTKACSIAELRTLVQDHFGLLIGGARSAPARQQTLLATIEWSFDLLSQDERRLMERLSVFSGGWTLEAAHVVACGGCSQFEALDALTHLVDKSVITSHCREGNRTRYSMLETVRDYCLDALAASGTHDTIARDHLRYFAELAELLETAVTNEETEAIERLAPELENIVHALGASARIADGTELALRLVAALGQYWLSLGLLHLGYRLTTEALSAHGADDSPARARALLVATRLAFFLGRNGEAAQWAEACLPLARLAGDDHSISRALSWLAYVAIEAGATERGIELYQESLEIARMQGDDEQIGRALTGIGIAYQYLDDVHAALPLFEEALHRVRNQRDGRAIAVLATNLAETYIELGRVRDAWCLLLEAVRVSSGTMSRWTMQVVLDGVARLASAVQDWPRGARVLGATEAALKLAGHKRQRDAAFEASVARVIRAALQPECFEAALVAGHALTVEQAIDEARDWLQVPGACPGVPAPSETPVAVRLGGTR